MEASETVKRFREEVKLTEEDVVNWVDEYKDDDTPMTYYSRKQIDKALNTTLTIDGHKVGLALVARLGKYSRIIRLLGRKSRRCTR